MEESRQMAMTPPTPIRPLSYSINDDVSPPQHQLLLRTAGFSLSGPNFAAYV